MSAAHIPPRWNVVAVIARREAATALGSPGVYIALTVALLAATWLLTVDVRGLQGAGLLVPASPFRAPLAIALLVLSAFFAVFAAISAARERESGTLEVLFYGPVDELSYVLGNAAGLLLAYMTMLPLLAASLALLSVLSGFALGSGILAAIALSIVPAAEIIAFGVLLSIGTSRIRTAVMVLVGVTILLLGVTLAYGIVLMIPISSPTSPALPLRDALSAANTLVRWISPFAYLESVIEGAILGGWRSAATDLLAALAYTAAMITLATMWLARRGVERRGE